jgi:3-hydroxybutyryl-CoA dehydrogenase
MSLAPIRTVCIVGAGWSGRQIAAQLLAHGMQVSLYDSNAEVIDSAKIWIAHHIEEQTASGYWNRELAEGWQGRMRVLAVMQQDDCDLVLECTFEQASLKRRVLKQLSKAFPAPCIIASNTSYFVPSILAKYVLDPERFLHWHFHVPVWLSKVVDIVPCDRTNESDMERVAELSRRVDQVPIIQRNENPGYIFNALLRGLILSALELAQRQVATPADIDFVWKAITKMEKGPFGIMDEIGLDVVQQSLGNARWDAQTVDLDKLMAILEPMVSSGKLGKKTGEGFFNHPNATRPGGND